jgi:hypothetical protein
MLHRTANTADDKPDKKEKEKWAWKNLVSGTADKNEHVRFE